MGTEFLIIGVIVLIVLLGAVLLLVGRSERLDGTRKQVDRIVRSQRTVVSREGRKLTKDEAASRLVRKSSTKLTLERRLRYARWKTPPVLYYGISAAISLVVVFLVSLKFNLVLTLVSLLSGPIFMGSLLNWFVDSRVKRFDNDYPAFLSSVVSLLKTGMNSTTAIESAAANLEDGSLVKEEVQLMLERLRFGVPEEKSVGSFGEDINHPEIELFVQALLLSRRVGGTLSETLDRLQKQVRKRQFFRASAKAAVGMQRGSIWIIVAIMAFMEVYLWFSYPQVVEDSLSNPMGWNVWQYAILLILVGIFWVRQVTKIKI